MALIVYRARQLQRIADRRSGRGVVEDAPGLRLRGGLPELCSQSAEKIVRVCRVIASRRTVQAVIHQSGIATRRGGCGDACRIGGYARDLEVAQQFVGLRAEPGGMTRLAHGSADEMLTE